MERQKYDYCTFIIKRTVYIGMYSNMYNVVVHKDIAFFTELSGKWRVSILTYVVDMYYVGDSEKWTNIQFQEYF